MDIYDSSEDDSIKSALYYLSAESLKQGFPLTQKVLELAIELHNQELAFKLKQKKDADKKGPIKG